MAETNDPMEEYREKLEEHELLKRAGVEAYVDVLVEMLGDKVNPDKAILIKEGMARMLGTGGPSLPMSHLPPDFEAPEVLDSIFEEVTAEGVTTVWDWTAVAAWATHVRRFPATGEVLISKYKEVLLILSGPSADSFWTWQTSRFRPSRRFRPVR